MLKLGYPTKRLNRSCRNTSKQSNYGLRAPPTLRHSSAAGGGFFMSLEGYIRGFVGTDYGRIVSSNACDGDILGLHRAGFSAEVLAAAYGNARGDPDATAPREFIRLIGDLARSPGNKRFCGQAIYGAAYKLNSATACTILPIGVVSSLATGHDIDRFASLTRKGLCDFSNPDWIDTFANLPPNERYFRLKPGRALGTSFIWFTSSLNLQQLFSAAVRRGIALAELGHFARDALGLVDRVPAPAPDPPLFLVALAFPASVAEKAGHFRPTFVEAGSHRRFSARARRTRTPRKYAWGKTIDLARLDADGTLENGLNERVCHPIERSMFDNAQVITFRILGKITKGNTCTNEQFSRALADGRTDSVLSTRLGGMP